MPGYTLLDSEDDMLAIYFHVIKMFNFNLLFNSILNNFKIANFSFLSIAVKLKVLANILGSKPHGPWCVCLSPQKCESLF